MRKTFRSASIYFLSLNQVTNMLFFLITNIIIREKVSILFYFCYIYTESKGVVTLLSKYNIKSTML